MFFQGRDKSQKYGVKKNIIKNYPNLSCFTPDQVKIKKMECRCNDIIFCKKCILEIKINDYSRWLKHFNLHPGYN